MKPHEKDLRWQEGTRTIQWGGMPVASNVDADFGPLLAAGGDLVRALLSDMGVAPDGEMHDGICHAWVRKGEECGPSCKAKRAALTKAGIL